MSDISNSTNQPLIEAALQYARWGWPVLPVWWAKDGKCACGKTNCQAAGKHPLGKAAPTGFNDATTDEATIRQWWADWPEANVGVRTGEEAGIFVLDVDVDDVKGIAGDKALADLERAHGTLPETIESITGRGGKHIFFRYPVGRQIKSKAGKPADGLDVRGEGGYVVAPPSIHVTGRQYAWSVDGHPDDLSAADAPEWLLDLVCADKREQHVADPGSPITEPGRNDALASRAGSMRHSGMSETAIRAALHAVNKERCQPPLDDAEVDGIAASISQYAPGGEVEGLSEFAVAAGRLAALSPEEYDRQRKQAADKLGVRVGTLDDEVETRRRTTQGEEGEPAFTTPPEPWPTPVDGNALLAEVIDVIGRHVITPQGAAEAMALWAVHAHAHDAASESPVLCFTSPDKRCGKTTALSVMQMLVPKPLLASSITPAATFRAVEKWKPTMLVDEADSYIKGNDELRGVLNSGHTKAGAYVIRCVGDDHEPKAFRTWAPKIIALIGKLPSTLHDRAVVIPMKRKLRGESVARLPRGDRRYPDLPKKLARWAADNMDALAKLDPEVPSTLNDRAADNWRPLLAIAEQIGGDWPERARNAALALSGDGDDDAVAIQLLGDIKDILETNKIKRIHSTDLCSRLVAMEDRPWPEWRHGKPITPAQLAKLLKPYEIRPCQVWVDGNKQGYELDWFEDAFARYLPDPTP